MKEAIIFITERTAQKSMKNRMKKKEILSFLSVHVNRGREGASLFIGRKEARNASEKRRWNEGREREKEQ